MAVVESPRPSHSNQRTREPLGCRTSEHASPSPAPHNPCTHCQTIPPSQQPASPSDHHPPTSDAMTTSHFLGTIVDMSSPCHSWPHPESPHPRCRPLACACRAVSMEWNMLFSPPRTCIVASTLWTYSAAEKEHWENATLSSLAVGGRSSWPYLRSFCFWSVTIGPKTTTQPQQ